MVSYIFDDGKWKKRIPVVSGTADGEKVTNWEWMQVSITEVPITALLEEWDSLIGELSHKELELIKVEDEWKEKEFHFRFMSDVDFIELYGKANDDTRKYHAKKECSELLREKHDLELSIDYLKRYLTFLRHVIAVKEYAL